MNDLFGLPLALPRDTATLIEAYLRRLWVTAYGSSPAGLDHDLAACSRYFDPLLRGQTLRTRIADLHDSAPPPAALKASLVSAVIVHVDERKRLIGVEGRLVLEALTSAADLGTVEISPDMARALTNRAVQTYRDWSLQRLQQVVALQTGRGKEYLQPKAVGLVLALLMNQATSLEQAVPSAVETEPPTGAERAIFEAAEVFAGHLGSRNSRSSSENRLRGGYAVTEARRRIPELQIAPLSQGTRGYFVQQGQARDVVDTLARELARRPNLDAPQLAAAYDAAVTVFRDHARTDGWQGGFHERAAETQRLRRSLLDLFDQHRTAESTGA